MSQATVKKIAFVVQYPENVSPAQRFRVELYKNLLYANNFQVSLLPFIDQHGYKIFFKKGFLLKKIWNVLKGFYRRIKLVFSAKEYDYLFLQYGAAPVGPPIFEWILIKLLKKKIIYDFDGAIWVEQPSENNNVPTLFRNLNKVASICKWSYKVSCGNSYLCDYALKYNRHVVFNPTCVDTETMHNLSTDHNIQKVTLGWTGSFSTLKYLNLIQPALYRLQKKYDFDIKIICNKKPSLNLKNVRYVEWSPKNEVIELATCQIGVMPLNDDEWSKGKCGFKLIQYLALEIPSVASPIGVNSEVIEEGINGFLCSTEEEWYTALEKLLLNAELRKKMGKAGRNKIVREYSLQSNASNFLSLFS